MKKGSQKLPFFVAPFEALFAEQSLGLAHNRRGI